jgi:tetratricopeptide (TPR) repeat protein
MDQIKYITIDDFENGIITYNFIINNHLDNFPFSKSIIYCNLSAFYLKKKDYVNALVNALTSIEYDKNNVKAWGRGGWAFKKLKKYNDALKAFEIANKIEPKQIYQIEIDFLLKELNKKITISNVFKIFKSDKFINRIKNNQIDKNLLDDILDSL